jgi:hypothetical protein
MLSFRVSALLLLATLASACDSRREARGPVARDTGARDDRAQFDEPGAIRVGWRGPTTGGGGFSVSVGSQFGQKEAEEVLRRLVDLDSSGAFKQFSCGDSVPHFGFDLTLHQEGEVQERIVSLGYTPYPKPWGRERCLHQGFDYLVALTFAQVDTGPSVDYGYKNPSTGEVIPSHPPGERHSRWWPTCDCAKRDSVQEWVKNGPKETSLGADAH